MSLAFSYCDLKSDKYLANKDSISFFVSTKNTVSVSSLVFSKTPYKNSNSLLIFSSSYFSIVSLNWGFSISFLIEIILLITISFKSKISWCVCIKSFTTLISKKDSTIFFTWLNDKIYCTAWFKSSYFNDLRDFYFSSLSFILSSSKRNFSAKFFS